MTTTVRDEAGESRYVIEVDGTRAGFAEYYLYQDLLALTHTEVSPEFQGKGLAGTLIRGALDDARSRDLRVEPFCPFVRGFISKNREYRDLVPADQWERFGLA